VKYTQGNNHITESSHMKFSSESLKRAQSTCEEVKLGP